MSRCCIETAERAVPRCAEDVIECEVCRAPIVWTGRAWAWSLATVAPEVERDAEGRPRRLWL